MLHPMGSDSSYFDEYIEYIKNNNKIYNKINFILPESPIMDVDYPNNKQYNVKSWFNYYTYNNNIIDEISVKDYNLACNTIITIINREATILGSYKRIFLLGVSQGGTLLFNILNKLEKPLGGLFCIKSLYMYKYVKLTKNTGIKVRPNSSAIICRKFPDTIVLLKELTIRGVIIPIFEMLSLIIS